MVICLTQNNGKHKPKTHKTQTTHKTVKSNIKFTTMGSSQNSQSAKTEQPKKASSNNGQIIDYHRRKPTRRKSILRLCLVYVFILIGGK